MSNNTSVTTHTNTITKEETSNAMDEIEKTIRKRSLRRNLKKGSTLNEFPAEVWMPNFTRKTLGTSMEEAFIAFVKPLAGDFPVKNVTVKVNYDEFPLSTMIQRRIKINVGASFNKGHPNQPSTVDSIQTSLDVNKEIDEGPLLHWRYDTYKYGRSIIKPFDAENARKKLKKHELQSSHWAKLASDSDTSSSSSSHSSSSSDSSDDSNADFLFNSIGNSVTDELFSQSQDTLDKQKQWLALKKPRSINKSF